MYFVLLIPMYFVLLTPIGYELNGVTSINAVKWEGRVETRRERYRCDPHDLLIPTHTMKDHFREKNFLTGYEPTPGRLQAVSGYTRRTKGP